MESICREQLLKQMEQIIASEFESPKLTTTGNGSNYEKARYFYVYLCHIHLNADFVLIRRTMPIYKYKKTVYQVFRRMWMRRKDIENEYLINYFKRQIDQFTKSNKVREEMKQMKLF